MLTKKQHDLLLFINDRLNASGVSPSFDEMKDALGLKSKSGIHRLIKALEERGFIKRMANRARALEIVKLPEADNAKVIKPDFSQNQDSHGNSDQPVPNAANDTVMVPMHGRIAAGTPVEAIEHVDSHIMVPLSMMGRGDCYALEISGESMIEMGILDGDTVLIESCQTARNGEVIVALVDGEEATLKTIQHQGQHVALLPANRDFDTQIFESNRVQVQGRLVGLLRQYH